MKKIIFKFLFLIIAVSVGLQVAALAIGDTTPMKPVVNPVTQTLYVVNNDVYNNHAAPAIKVYTPTWSYSSSITLPATTRCHGLAVSPDGNKLYVGVDYPNPSTADEIRVYDLNNGIPGSYVAMSGGNWTALTQPAGIALGGGNLLYITDKSGGKIKVFNTGTNAFVQDITSLQGKSGIYDIVTTSTSANTYKIYVTQQAPTGAIYVFNYDNGTITLAKTLSGLTRPTYLKIVGDKLFVAVNGSDGVDIKVYSTTDESPVGNVKSGVVGFFGWVRFDVSADGKWLIFKKAQDSNQSVNKLYEKRVAEISGDVVADDMSTIPAHLPAGTVVPTSDGVAISADRSKLAVSYSFNGDVLVVDISIPTGNHPPADPTDLKQYKLDGTTEIPWQGTTDENKIIVKFSVSDPADKDMVTPVIAYRPQSSPPTFLPYTYITLEAVDTSNGPVTVTATVPASGTLNNGGYEWQVKTVDPYGLSSADVYYHYEDGKVDFYVDSTANEFKIISTSPANAAINVPLNAPIVVKFNREVNPSTFSLNITPNIAVTYVWSQGNTRVTAMHSSNFSLSTNYSVEVSAKDISNTSLTGTRTFAFTTSNNPNNLAPYIITTTPTDGATDVYLNQPIIVTFSRSVDSGSLQYSCTPDPTGWSVSWNSASTEATLIHNDFSTNTSYSFEVTAAKSNTISLIPGPAPNPFTFQTGTQKTVIVYDLNIKRDADTVGSSVTVTWKTNPVNSAVDLYVKEGNYLTTPADWTDGPKNVTIGTYTDANQVGIGSAKYYKIVPAGTPKANIVLTSAVVGKFDLALTEGFNFVSLPLINTTTDIAAAIGTQLKGDAIPPLADKIYSFKADKSGFDQAWLNSSDNIWYDPDTGNVSTMKIAPDKGYWIEIATGHATADVTVVGSISETARGPISITSAFNLVGSAFPVSVSIDNSGIRQSGATAAAIPPLACKVYSYKADKSGFEQAWLNSADNRWYDPDTNVLSTMQLSPGKAYWIEEADGSAGFNWNYPKPY